MMTAIVAVCVALAIVHVGLNIYVTRRVLAHEDYDAFQRRAQVLVVWLLPIAGLIAVWWLLPLRPRRKRNGLEYADEYVQESVYAEE